MGKIERSEILNVITHELAIFSYGFFTAVHLLQKRYFLAVLFLITGIALSIPFVLMYIRRAKTRNAAIEALKKIRYGQ